VLIPESNKGQQDEECKSNISLEEIPIDLDNVIVEGSVKCNFC
jgi:hypothetical protein